MKTAEYPVVRQRAHTQHRPRPVPYRGPSPRYRPWWLLRGMVGLAAVGAILFTIALMWSDRAPGLVEFFLHDRAQALWDRIDPQRLGDVQRSDLPRTDFMVHIAVWGTVSGLVFVATWTWRSLVLGSGALAVLSYLIEIGQGRYSSTRHVDITDAFANTVGIAAAAVVAAILFVAYNALAGFVVAAFNLGRSDRHR